MAMTENLAVFLGNAHVGTLLRVKNGARFQYDETIASLYAGLPLLSTALPVQETPYDAATTENWFSGLLPESTRLDEARRFFGMEGTSYLDVLSEIGWECAGAVSIVPESCTSKRNKDAGELPITTKELAERLAALPSHPFDTSATMRVSLGGFQEKLCVVASFATSKDGYIMPTNVAIPLNGAPTTHILKPEPERFPGMVQAEAWAMCTASMATPTATVALLDTESLTEEAAVAPETLIVERYDRKRGEAPGSVARIHQEDCCQALGIPAERKYAAESSPKKSDPSFSRIAQLLVRYSADVPRQLETLLRQMVVNVALGNTDAHAKNYALLHEGGLVSLAPLYDVVPTLEMTPGVLAMGMRIDGRIRIDRIGREQLVNEAIAWGLERSAVEKILDDSLEALREGARDASEKYPGAGEKHQKPFLERLTRLLGQHAPMSAAQQP